MNSDIWFALPYGINPENFHPFNISRSLVKLVKALINFPVLR